MVVIAVVACPESSHFALYLANPGSVKNDKNLKGYRVEKCRFWRFLQGPGGVQGGFGGSWGLPFGFLGSRCENVGKCRVLDPKLGSMLEQKNCIFKLKT